MSHDGYQSPLSTRYASPAMQRLWSARHRAATWRRLWLVLAEEQRRLGVDMPQQAIDELRAALQTADLEQVRSYEARLRHDVVAHIHHLGDQAPAARPFVHLGATSAYVTDNADLLVMQAALGLLIGRLRAVLRIFRDFALRHRSLPTVAYTHFQPAQLTTVGKRATLWLLDLALDAQQLREAVAGLPFRGCKGTTGTQASYLELFDGDHARVRELDRAVAAAFGFSHTIPVSGQTYTRKIDSRIVDLLGGIAQTASKLATDIRLLQHEGELLEPFEREQVGSSAMAYKRNPARCERICGLARFVLSLHDSTAHTAATQWMERTLDDSANRRLVLPEAFLATDGLLVLLTNVGAGLEVREATIRRNTERVMPFMATERWLIHGVKAGGDRQTLHEIIRRASREATDAVERGGKNDLLDRLAGHEAFARIDRSVLQAELEPSRYVGRAPEQVRDFVDEYLDPMLDTLAEFAVADEAEVTV